MLNFEFLEKGLGIVFLPQFVYGFLGKIFLMLHSNNRPNFIAWLHFYTYWDIEQYVYWNYLLTRV